MHAPSADNKHKLGKLIRLLGSGVDGEVVAAARALARTLESSGSNLHELASIVEGGGRISDADMRKLFDAGFEAGRAEGVRATEEAMHGENEFRSIGEPTFHEMALYLQKRISKVGKNHIDFVDRMAGLSVSASFEPSFKQAKYLKSLFLQAGGGRK
jgi:hypothetical protein